MKEFIDKTTENLEEKIKVTSLEIIVTGSKEKPYFEIKYKELGKEDYDIGYSSYDLNNVFTWKDECFDIVNELAEEYNGGWIPCSKEMPKAGTHRDVWISLENEVVSYRARWYLDHFEWDNGFAIKERIVAWMPNDVPEPYMEGESGLYRAKSVDGEYQEYKGDWK